MLGFEDGLQFHHWLLLGLVFWLLDRYKIGRLSSTMALAALLQAIISALNPEMAWTLQVLGFSAMCLLGFVIFLIQSPSEVKPSRSVERKLDENIAAAALVGTRVPLAQPLYPGSSKLEVKGRFWKVIANRDFPAGSTVEVVGHKGNTLEIVSAEAGGPSTSQPRFRGTLSLDVYHRDPHVEDEYGAPDFDYWLLFQQALHDHSKLSLVYAYHVLCGLKGMNIEQARAKLNTYTLALYDTTREGQYLTLQKEMYSQPRIYNFLYMNGAWTGKDINKFEEEINHLVAALHTDWAARFRGATALDQVLRAVMMIRKQQKLASQKT